jgi:hypothetical protein
MPMRTRSWLCVASEPTDWARPLPDLSVERGGRTRCASWKNT